MSNKMHENTYEYKNKHLYEVFHELSGLSYSNTGTFKFILERALDSSYFNPKSFADEYMHNGCKAYPNTYKNEWCENEIVKTIRSRRSEREFGEKACTSSQLFCILNTSLGKTSAYTHGDEEVNMYTYPSAGGIDSIRAIVIINNVSQINKGVYYYDPSSDELLQLYNGWNHSDYTKLTASLALTVNSCFSIHLISNPTMKCFKYQDRGYRFLNIEAGHIAQNMYLTAQMLEMGAVSSGGFLDLDYSSFLNFIKAPSQIKNTILLYEMYFGNK